MINEKDRKEPIEEKRIGNKKIEKLSLMII